MRLTNGLTTGTRLRIAVAVVVVLVNVVHQSALAVLPWALLVVAADLAAGFALTRAPSWRATVAGALLGLGGAQTASWQSVSGTALSALFYLLLIAAFLRHTPAVATTRSWLAVVAAFVASYLPFTLPLVAKGRSGTAALLAAEVLVVLGLGLSVWLISRLTGPVGAGQLQLPAMTTSDTSGTASQTLPTRISAVWSVMTISPRMPPRDVMLRAPGTTGIRESCRAT